MFTALKRDRAEALLVVADPLTFSGREQNMHFALENRLPGIYEFRAFVDAGGLMSYGPSQKALYRRGAYYVDKILRGAKPVDLPVEQPTRFEFVLNARTARAIGIDIPASVLLNADEVIE